jgi:hypothetical protein
MTRVLRKETCLIFFTLILMWTMPAKAALIINEIMYDPFMAGDTDGEWFELYNPDAALDLMGYAISDLSSSVSISTSLIIPAGGYLIFGRNSDMTANGGVNVDYTFSFSLNNGGDTLSIMAPDNSVLNSITYGTGTSFPIGNGASIYFTGIGVNTDGSNWEDASLLGITYGDGDFGTPGALNAAAVPEPASLLLIGTGLMGILVGKIKN